MEKIYKLGVNSVSGRKITPQKKKQNSYEKDHRYCYEYRNAARKLWEERKVRNRRIKRRILNQLIKRIENEMTDDKIEKIEDETKGIKIYEKGFKAGVLTLREVVEHKRKYGKRPVY